MNIPRTDIEALLARAEHAPMNAANTAGFAFAYPSPNCASMMRTAFSKYVSAVATACNIKLCSLSGVDINPPVVGYGPMVAQGGAA